MFTKYDKFFTAAIGVLANALYQYNVTNPTVWVTTLIAVATALGVFTAKNKV